MDICIFCRAIIAHSRRDVITQFVTVEIERNLLLTEFFCKFPEGKMRFFPPSRHKNHAGIAQLLDTHMLPATAFDTTHDIQRFLIRQLPGKSQSGLWHIDMCMFLEKIFVHKAHPPISLAVRRASSKHSCLGRAQQGCLPDGLSSGVGSIPCSERHSPKASGASSCRYSHRSRPLPEAP